MRYAVRFPGNLESEFFYDREHSVVLGQYAPVDLVKLFVLGEADEDIDQFVTEALSLEVIVNDYGILGPPAVGIDDKPADADEPFFFRSRLSRPPLPSRDRSLYYRTA
jgi:hypothetical protein